MSPTKPVLTSRATTPVRSAPQARILDAALDLFAVHGVSGTSLQMIADVIGVTKAAVYHQFKTKDEIVIAVTERELAILETTLDTAEAEETRDGARKVVLDRVVDMAVDRRALVSILQFDPVITRLLADHEPFVTLLERMFGLLTGEFSGPEARVSTAMLSAAIAGAVIHPLVTDIDDETLRAELKRLTRRVLGLS